MEITISVNNIFLELNLNDSSHCSHLPVYSPELKYPLEGHFFEICYTWPQWWKFFKVKYFKELKEELKKNRFVNIILQNLII